jgi:hypothetical protein
VPRTALLHYLVALAAHYNAAMRNVAPKRAKDVLNKGLAELVGHTPRNETMRRVAPTLIAEGLLRSYALGAWLWEIIFSPRNNLGHR